MHLRVVNEPGARVPDRWLGGIQRQLAAVSLSPFLRQKLRTLFSQVRSEDLEFLKELIEAGKVAPVIRATYPLRDVPDAVRALEQGHARGKLVVTVSAADADRSASGGPR